MLPRDRAVSGQSVRLLTKIGDGSYFIERRAISVELPVLYADMDCLSYGHEYVLTVA